ncbi:helix-turn-helix domain-containing protein [Brochothrix thermosphacta]|uniref:helix-turn-helix domain-containing protein n=1 Tax=Brochothrix thermosphacta TaxID=2756 RepID=UPI00083F5F13|nr:helix-turn-helix transcriptional regulator [Brochothrix thermosphacta]ODJ74565.1 hypothetical protein BFR39_01075 [Brochothrix thermosphacta]
MIANNLATLLTERRIKITRLAKETGISRSTLTSIAQNDTKMIQLEVVNQICMFLEIDPDDFFIFIPIDIKISYEMSNLHARLYEGTLQFEVEFFFDFITKKGTDTFESTALVSNNDIKITDEGTSISLFLDIDDNFDLFSEYRRKIPASIWWKQMELLGTDMSASLSDLLTEYFSSDFGAQDIILNTDYHFDVQISASPF